MNLRKAVALCHLAEVAGETSDPIRYCRAMVDHLHTRLGYRRVGILLCVSETAPLRLYACNERGPTEEAGEASEARGGIRETAMRSCRPVVVNDIAILSGEARARRGVRAAAAFPLVADGGAFGVIDIESDAADKFDWDDFVLMSALAASLAQMLVRHLGARCTDGRATPEPGEARRSG